MSREKIIGKVLLRGKLKLCSPLLIGSGAQADGNDIDTQILRDKNGVPFIPGTSIAGVLRAALPQDQEIAFFGGSLDALNIVALKGIKEVQSAMEIDDVELVKANVVMRDGVCIDEERGVASDEKKFDYELVERGSTGKFSAVITLRDYHRAILPNIPAAVENLAKSIAAGFRLGAMTSKGFGRVQMGALTVDYYDFTKKADAVAWLSNGHNPSGSRKTYAGTNGQGSALTESNFIVDANFSLAGSLIVKDADVPAAAQNGRNAIHATMKESVQDFLIPGPSVKGALRHHAGKILARLGCQNARPLLNKLMGLDSKAMEEAKNRNDKKTVRQSRFLVDEVYIDPNKVTKFAQTRNRIDRFTGGTIGGALFTTEAVWGSRNGNSAPIHIHFEIRDAEAYEAGLALLLLKDLSLGRLPLGGEKSTGRGVLQGVDATIQYAPQANKTNMKKDIFEIQNGKLVKGDGQSLESCVTALVKKAGEVQA